VFLGGCTWAYLLGAGAMILGGLVAVFFAVDAEGKSPEEIAKPLSVVAKPAEAIFRAGAPRPLIAGRKYHCRYDKGPLIFRSS
jgi:hypothetical protein